MCVHIRPIARGGSGDLIELPFDLIHVYIIRVYRVKPGSHSRFCRDCIASLNFLNVVLDYQKIPVFLLSTHIFVALAMVVWWAWPSKVNMVAKKFVHAYVRTK